MVEIKFKKDFTEVQTNIKNRIKKLSYVSTPLFEMVAEMFASVGQNFREQGTDKGPWRALAPTTLYNYAHRKKKKNLNPVILRDTGHLQNSIGKFFEGNTAGLSTNVHYAPPLHFGSKKRHLPARPYMHIREDAQQRIFAIAREWGFEA